jgi:DNA-binding CsgD family transcriptional regulator
MDDVMLHLPSGCFIVDQQARILDVNPAAVSLCGASDKDEVLKFNLFYYADSHLKAQMLLDYVNQHRYLNQHQGVLKRINGQRALILLSAYQIGTSDKIMIQVVSADASSFFLQSLWADRLLNDVEALKSFVNQKGETVLMKLLAHYRQTRERYMVPASVLNEMTQANLSSVAIRCPQLTLNEMQLCSLLKTGLTTSEIAQITGTTANAVRVNLHRIIGKLQVSGRQGLLNFLSEHS